ncbi:glycosyl hydrolase [Paenibacillus doosanensis]|uniref:glycosyl hydrolase n=1 Tax=Paenibacillus doosanensis TaxID=1229154 RepID=UPI00217FE65A|nr:glycosyl hydrolase [Paenibacillus doosanensis]MCS7460776.1 glycosyl hydrolase [Paenibacillus doosanensis]
MFDMQQFKNPSADYRIHPFWFWNGDMEDDEIRRQIDEMADKGLGGAFVCARQGLNIPYLSDVWFRKVKVAVEAAQARGLYIWLYDEYPYPSGIAGGEVTLEHPEAKHYTLAHHAQRAEGGERLSVELPWARILYAKAIPVLPSGRKLWDEAVDIRSSIGNFQTEPIFQKAGLTAYNQKRFFTYRTVQKLEWTAPEGQWEVLIVQEKEIEDFKYYGTFVDPCNREAMATFIRLTHDRYAQHLGEYFGGTIKGMFTDEIGLLGSIPWSPQLAAFFKQQNGYDLCDHLHALLYADADNAAQVRYDYYQSVHLLLLGAYHKQVHDWCERHGLDYITEVPSVRMTTQLYSHIPGGDSAHEKLGRSLDWILDQNAGNFRSDPKMVSSIARQLNRERNLIECFHSVGWSMTLQDAKWMIDRMAAMGTNLFNFHAFFYTLDGLTKHDAPPSQFLQNPYWRHFRQLGDYTGRISYVMSSGEADISVAVLQPTTSLWTQMGNPFHGFQYGGKNPEEQQKLEDLKRWWSGVCSELTKSGRDFDHLDPELLAEADAAGGKLSLGKASYSVLIMPPMTNLESAAWRKIQLFAEQGGIVISLGQLPYETIEPGQRQQDSESIRRLFGLTEPVREQFWSGGNTEPDWVKGAGSVYFLPCTAASETQQAVKRMSALLGELQPQAVQLLPACGDWGLLTQTRKLSEDTALVFISNQEGTPRDITLRASERLWGDARLEGCDAEFQLLSLDRGDAAPAQGTRDGSAWLLPLSLAPYESKLVQLKRGKPAALPAAAQPWQLEADAAAPWRLSALQPNAVRFDTFRLAVGDAGSEAKRAPLEAPAVTAKTFIDQCADLAEASALPVQMSQLFGTPMKIAMSYPLQAVYSAAFTVDKLPQRAMLVLDKGALSGSGYFRINGHRVDTDAFKPVFLYDPMNIGCDIASYLCEGVNELEAAVEIRHDWDGLVDAVYLTGDFLVRFDEERRPVIAAPAEQQLPLTAGPYPGYPYYAGTFSFERELVLPSIPAGGSFELSLTHSDDAFHDSAEVLVNGQSLGVCAWSPYRWLGDAKLLQEGSNRIEIRVTNTLIGLLEGKYFDYAQHELKPVPAR